METVEAAECVEKITDSDVEAYLEDTCKLVLSLNASTRIGRLCCAEFSYPYPPGIYFWPTRIYAIMLGTTRLCAGISSQPHMMYSACAYKATPNEIGVDKHNSIVERFADKEPVVHAQLALRGSYNKEVVAAIKGFFDEQEKVRRELKTDEEKSSYYVDSSTADQLRKLSDKRRNKESI